MSYRIQRHREFGFDLYLRGLPPIWCATREVAARVLETAWNWDL